MAGLSCGIVGLPNVGKSTLFNAITGTAKAQAANYPFCTIEPNVSSVMVPDRRLEVLAEIAKSQAIIPARMEFIDIAGLVEGASKGEGLGNKFLSHIREVDAIAYVLRCFENDENGFVTEDVIHVSGRVDPVADAQVVRLEMTLADLESLNKRLPALEKKAKQDQEAREQVALIKSIIPYLEDGGQNIRSLITAQNEIAINRLQLLSTKPFFYICNVANPADTISTGNKHVAAVAEMAAKEGIGMIVIAAKMEEEIAHLDNPEDKAEFLASYNLTEGGLDRIVRHGYSTIGLETFFTIGPKEAHAWTIRKGSKAVEAAEVIHSDFAKGFIRAQVISYNSYTKYQGEQGAREAGAISFEGRDYIVQDGDIVHFHFAN